MAEAAALGGRTGVQARTVREDFERFVEAELPRAHRLAWRLVGGDDAAADDVIQDALCRAYRALGTFRGDAQLQTWFFRIVVRQAHNHRRWRALRQLWTGAPLHDAPAPSAAQGDPALRRRIEEALARLPRAQRDVFLLVHWEGFSVTECARILGKADGTVRSHMARARSALRSALRDVHEEGGER
jgi:RNA polymerase sigma-70 factor, ECF subfamily